MNRLPVHGRVWDGIRTEFTLPTMEQVRRMLAELLENPEPVMRQLVPVLISNGTLCLGIQFLPRRTTPPHGPDP